MSTLTLIFLLLTVFFGLFVIVIALIDVIPDWLDIIGIVCSVLIGVFGLGAVISAAVTTKEPSEQIRIIKFSSKEYRLEYKITECQEKRDTTYVLIRKN